MTIDKQAELQKFQQQPLAVQMERVAAGGDRLFAQEQGKKPRDFEAVYDVWLAMLYVVNRALDGKVAQEKVA